MGDGSIYGFLSRSLFFLWRVTALVFVISTETNKHQFPELSDPKTADPSARRVSSRDTSIRLNCDGCICLRFVPGSVFHRWYLRFLTDAITPLHLYGDIIWVFNPGIIKTFSLKGIGLNKSRVGVMQGRTMITNRQRSARLYKGHDLEPLQSTYQIFLLARVMRNAFRSLIYMVLAYYKCMKRGLNRFILLPVRLPFGKQGYFHFFIGIVFNSLYLFHRLYLNGSMYHVNSYD